MKGRGAGSNTPNRFERVHADPRADHLEPILDDDTGEVLEPSPRTQFLDDHSRTILSSNSSPDIPFTYSVNPYRGCEHGCAYCYARPTHEYLGHSAGIDFETKIYVKRDAPALLREALMKPKWVPETITMAGVTDIYQPAERRFEITRGLLKVFAEFRNPVALITKNRLVTRDLDLLADLATDDCAKVFISVTTLDAGLCGVLEPRTSRPTARLEAIRKLSEAGVPVGVMVAPVIPGLTDHELPSILDAAAKAGATSAGMVPLRLPLSVAPLFEEWVRTNRPERADKILNRQREIRGGKLNDSSFGSRMSGEGAWAENIGKLFRLYRRKVGLDGEGRGLSTAHFRRPGDQLTLL